MAILVFLVVVLSFGGFATVAGSEEPDLLDPLSIPKWVNQLTGPPPVHVPTSVDYENNQPVLEHYTVEMRSFSEQILPYPLPMTPVWGYAGSAKDALGDGSAYDVQSSPGATFEATRGVPIEVTWVNSIDDPHMFAVDPTMHWANPNGMEMPGPPFEEYPPGYEKAQSPVPLIPHLHGAEVQSTSDGNPEAWFTWNGIHGPAYNTLGSPASNAAVFKYWNEQPATTLWYHDHGLGITRINVMSGLAGFYLLRDPDDPITSLLPSGKYEMPLVIQDRIFRKDGSFYFPSEGVNPDVHPYWMPEFFGNTIMVNGKVWPNMNVDQGQYRFRVLDGSNARFYTLSFSNLMPFTVIGTDGGYLRAPAVVTQLTIAPGERYDILVDFSGLAAGTTVQLKNTAKAPFPTGTPPQGSTVGQIMQFTVTGQPGREPAVLQPILDHDLDPFPSLTQVDNRRILVLVELEGEYGPLAVLLNGQTWEADVSERPRLGATEEWVIVNPTADTHPIHLHLVQFQLVYRQRLRAQAYLDDWMELNGGEEPPYETTPHELDPTPYLRGRPTYAPTWEQGWKDTMKMNPGEITVIRVRFAPIGGGDYPFDATLGPGYVWHCHILDHEDNEMMRPYYVLP